MTKIRGPFASRDEAQVWVASVQGQGVPFKEFQEREVPTQGGFAGRRTPAHTVLFALYEDPGADWPDEVLVLDEHKGWTVRHPQS